MARMTTAQLCGSPSRQANRLAQLHKATVQANLRLRQFRRFRYGTGLRLRETKHCAAMQKISMTPKTVSPATKPGSP